MTADAVNGWRISIVPADATNDAGAPPGASGAPARIDADEGKLTLTVGEAAELLGISRAFAYELVQRGELPAVKLGRRLLVPARRLRRMVEEGWSGP